MSYTKSSISLKLNILLQLYQTFFFKIPKLKTENYFLLVHHSENRKVAFTLNNAITTEKKLMNAVAKISGHEKTAGLLYTWVWKL
jgi:hypothetical protein